MTPKSDDDKKSKQDLEKSNQPNGHIIADECDCESDIEEIAAVNDSLDSLSSALDFIEKRTDDIKTQILELLKSNKEIRKAIIEENSQNEARAS